MVLFLVALAVLGLDVARVTCGSNVVTEFVVTHTDMAVSGGTLKLIYTDSLIKCSSECGATPGCRSFNYQRQGALRWRACELNGRGASTVETRRGYAAFKLRKTTGGCGEPLRITGGSANSSSSDSPSGTAVSYSCQRPRVKLGTPLSVCSPDGHWSEPSKCCASLILNPVAMSASRIDGETPPKYGSWMMDAGYDGDPRVWYVPDAHIMKNVYEFNSLSDFKAGTVNRKIVLSTYLMDGTGHVVYKGFLFYHKHNSRFLVRYDINKSRDSGHEVLKEIRLSNNVEMHGNCAYKSGEKTDVDFAVDEKGLWVLWGKSDKLLRITKIDPDRFEIGQTWKTSIEKTKLGDAFLFNGVLYGTDSHDDSPTFIKYLYDTDTSKDVEFRQATLPVPNYVAPGKSDAFNTMLAYYPLKKKLFSWNEGHAITYDWAD